MQDVRNPAVGIAGGTLSTAGWKRGVQSVAVAANDNTGIRRVRAFVDGVLSSERGLACDDRYLKPCPASPVTSLGVDVSRLAEGPHRLDVHAIDSGNNVASAARTIYVDNRAPDPPEQLTAIEPGWVAQNSFSIAWEKPSSAGSPISGALYQLCPESSAAKRGCTATARATGEQIDDLRAPAAGAWRVKLWLVDQAGNENIQTSRDTVVRWDPDPPVLRLADRDAGDPARIRAIASDATSGIEKREIEVRRNGEETWHSLAVSPDARGFSAMVDDERLKRGTYAVRARATDRAGNVRSVDGAAIALPIRLSTKLRVGKAKRVHKRVVLQRRPRVRFGRSTTLSGRLISPGGNPLADRDIDISELRSAPGATWRPAGTVRTGKAGRFAFKAPAGPSRRLRFRYPGTATIRGATAGVHLRVRATSSMDVDRKRVVNGEAVTFTGRIRGEAVPSGGKLLQLQVFSRGSWLTFATPRTDARGRWQHDYRFTATRGVTRYRFRVRIPREAGFPYDAGTSRAVRVEVVGL